MKKAYLKYIVTAALSMAAVTIYGQQKTKSRINISLTPKVSTFSPTSEKRAYFNIGLLSKQQKLYGLGINILGGSTQTLRGIQLAGLYHTGGEFNGLSIAGIANINELDSRGVTISGIANVTGGSYSGIIASGFINLIAHDVSGLSISPFQINGQDNNGLSIGGILNFVDERAQGVALAGIMNYSGDATYGLSIAGITNINKGVLAGVSIATIANSAKFNKGVQIALYNNSQYLKGIQLGVVNRTSKENKGLQLGLININPTSRYQFIVYGGNRTKTSVAFRVKNKVFYNVIGVGTAPYLNYSDKFSASITYRTGAYITLNRYLDLSADLGYQHINTYANKDKEQGIPRRMYALEGRGNIELNFNKHFGAIVTAGWGTCRWYSESRTYKKGLLCEAGLSYTM